MKNIKQMVLAALFLALGLTLPFLTGQIREIGNKLLPMHLPILLCGFICGWKYGLLVGFITPLLRCFLFSMPAPTSAIGMAFELAVYGAVTGFLYKKLIEKKGRIYISLLLAMIAGRIVKGIANVIVLGITGSAYTWKMFISGTMINAIPGVVVQLILIPILVLTLEKTGAINTED